MAITPAFVRTETRRRLRRMRIRLGDEIRQYRLDAGLTLTELGAMAGVDRSHLARIEAGIAAASVEVLTAIGVSLGADLSMRYFPGAGPRLVDRFQAPMVEAFLRELNRHWTVRLEVPVFTPARGVIDAALTEQAIGVAVAAEFQSEFRRVVQQIRWNNEKADGLAARLTEELGAAPPTVSCLLVLRSTIATREIARRFHATLAAAYPARTVDVIDALTGPTAHWPGAGIAWMRVENGTAELLHGPPRGVALGR